MDRLLFFIKKLIPQGIFSFLRPIYHFITAFSAALFYGFPSRHLSVIGVTGTKGKTTVVELLHEILSASGTKVASISSLRFKIDNKEIKNDRKMTMPGRFFVQNFLHRARKAGCKYAILEVTSEGIKQFRHRFIKFNVAVMTNVAPEHLEAHGGLEKYLRAKLDLFWRLSPEGTAVINRDDPNWQRFSAATAAQKIFYDRNAIEARPLYYRGLASIAGSSGIEFEINGVAMRSPLQGEFNFFNILAAIAAGLSQHIALEKIAAAVSRVYGIPGRMEFIQREPFAVVVDYAHTPDSLRKVYQTLREPVTINQLLPKRRLICVLGSAGGGRDKWKRPELGKIAAEFCGEIILTNEDPYDENPQTILDNIESGFSSNHKLQITNYKKIIDRREAIRYALKSAQAGDVVIITGKGAEPWIMGPKGTKIPWDDRETTREELKNVI